jgi:hypothetical protein
VRAHVGGETAHDIFHSMPLSLPCNRSQCSGLARLAHGSVAAGEAHTQRRGGLEMFAQSSAHGGPGSASTWPWRIGQATPRRGSPLASERPCQPTRQLPAQRLRSLSTSASCRTSLTHLVVCPPGTPRRPPSSQGEIPSTSPSSSPFVAYPPRWARYRSSRAVDRPCTRNS